MAMRFFIAMAAIFITIFITTMGGRGGAHDAVGGGMGLDPIQIVFFSVSARSVVVYFRVRPISSKSSFIYGFSSRPFCSQHGSVRERELRDLSVAFLAERRIRTPTKNDSVPAFRKFRPLSSG